MLCKMAYQRQLEGSRQPIGDKHWGGRGKEHKYTRNKNRMNVCGKIQHSQNNFPKWHPTEVKYCFCLEDSAAMRSWFVALFLCGDYMVTNVHNTTGICCDLCFILLPYYMSMEWQEGKVVYLQDRSLPHLSDLLSTNICVNTTKRLRAKL
jgi:hypothetical protein